MNSTVFYVTGIILLSAVVLPGAAHPTSSREELNIREYLEDRDNVKLIENILVSMERMLGENLFKFYNKINSLTQLSGYLLEEGGDMPVATGRHNDMSRRCPVGFVAVPGDRNCYYFSPYKQPWVLARETCLQLGPHVDMLSIETTKKQFIVTHLLQSDADNRHVKKWWTAGKGTGHEWAWFLRLSIESFFLKFFQTDADQFDTQSDSCLVLDADYYYQWKSVRCNGDNGRTAGRTDRGSEQTLPSHHFICQTAALEPSIEEEPKVENNTLTNLMNNLDHSTTTAGPVSTTTAAAEESAVEGSADLVEASPDETNSS